MSPEEIKEAKKKYNFHRYTGTARCGFELTFEEWLDIWIQSGHWNKRGRCKGEYVMSRFSDSGPYKVGNVFIKSQTYNNAEYCRTRKGLPGPKISEETKAKMKASHTGVKRTPHTAETKAKISAARKGQVRQ
jgi:hypothetical protein